jgi:UDP-3-O-[3-hydroxymyristoyl] glucosamine N-acyltransferase
MAGKTLEELAKHTQSRVVGDPSIVIEGVSTLESAGESEITFLSNKKYLPLVKTTSASAVIVGEEIESNAALLVAEDPYFAFQQAVVLLHGHRKHKDVGISELASVSDSARIGEGCNIHNFATISDNVTMGKNCQVYPGVFIGPDVEVGDDCIFYANAVIYDGTSIGSRVIVHSSASVGQDGYGFATHDGAHHKIPQIGRVIVEDDVELGSGCAIERGTLDETIVGKGCKVGDQVAIGHGTKVGAHCLLVPKVGIAGSVTLGQYCVLGGQVGVVGHIKIGNMVKVGAQAGVINDVPDGTTLLGSPAIEASKAKRAYSLIQYLPDMRKKIKKLEKRLDSHEEAGR